MNTLNFLICVGIIIQSLVLFPLSTESFRNNIFIFSNLNNFVFYFLFMKVYGLMLPIPTIGKTFRILLQMLKIVFWFTFFSFFIFLLIAFLIN